MITTLNIRKVSEILNGVGLFLIAVCFLFIHLNAQPAQTQLTYLPLILPLFLLLPVKKEIYPTEIKFIFLVLCIFISSLISYGWLGEVFTQDFRSHWIYLLVFGVVAILSQSRVSKFHLIVLLILASSMVAYNVITEYLANATRGFHTHGKPIFFGNIALTSGLVSLVLSMKKDNHWFVRGLLFFSAMVGITGSVWSQSRGGWLFLVIFLSIFIFLNIIKAKNRKRACFYSLLLIVFIFLASLPFKNFIDTRISSAYSNIYNYIVHKKGNSSVGLRFGFWEVSVEQFIDEPLIGSARSGFLEKKYSMIEEGLLDARSKHYEHAHSDIFWNLGTKGLLGLITLYGLYAFLLRFYYVNCKRNEIRIYALSGLTVVGSYIVYGFSESFFSMKLGIGYFIILNALLIRLICINRSDQEKPLILLQRE